MEHDKNYPTKFDLNDFSLSSFFGAIPVYLNLQKEGKINQRRLFCNYSCFRDIKRKIKRL